MKDEHLMILNISRILNFNFLWMFRRKILKGKLQLFSLRQMGLVSETNLLANVL